MKKPRDGINVSAGQENADDGRASRLVWRSKLRRDQNLRAQVGRSIQQKPICEVYREGELRLCARVSAQGSGA